MSFRFTRRGAAAALASAMFAASCGGGGGGEEPPAPSPEPAAASARISRVVVAGDSLADVGTFGFRATVQDASDPEGYPVYPEIVARELGAGRPCNFFSSEDGDSFRENAGCTGFAVGGAMVRNPVTRGGSRVPFSLEHQLERAVQAQGGAWRAGDLLVIDAGANDAAAFADAYLDAQSGGTAEEVIFLALLRQELDASTIADARRPGNRFWLSAVAGSARSLAQPWSRRSSSSRIARRCSLISSCSSCRNASLSTMSLLAKWAVMSGITTSTMMEMSRPATIRPAVVVGYVSP